MNYPSKPHIYPIPSDTIIQNVIIFNNDHIRTE